MWSSSTPTGSETTRGPGWADSTPDTPDLLLSEHGASAVRRQPAAAVLFNFLSSVFTQEGPQASVCWSPDHSCLIRSQNQANRALPASNRNKWSYPCMGPMGNHPVTEEPQSLARSARTGGKLWAVCPSGVFIRIGGACLHL